MDGGFGEKGDKTWDYNLKRKDFIQARQADGFKYATASELWTKSLEKAQALCTVSVPELKRRKFLPKGCSHNPWFDRVHGKPEG